MLDSSPFFIEDKAFAHFEKYPEVLKDSWILLSLFDEKHYLGGVICLYFNNKYPKGTIIISKKINNSYPDAYATFDKDGSFNRIYTHPRYRKSGVIKTLGMVLRTLVYNKSNIYISTAKINTGPGIEVMKSGIRDIIGAKSNEEALNSEYWQNQKGSTDSYKIDFMESRDPIFPYCWHDKAYGKK